MSTIEIAQLPDMPLEHPTPQSIGPFKHDLPFDNTAVATELTPKPFRTEEESNFLKNQAELMLGRVKDAVMYRKMYETEHLKARTDTLTHLPNRLALGERLNEIYTNPEEFGNKWVVFLDLNDMKGVNDLSDDGHSAGDDYLIAAANAIRSVTRFEEPDVTEHEETEVPKVPLRNPDEGFRISGDEFVMIMDASTEINHLELEVTLKQRLVRQLLLEVQKSELLRSSDHKFWASLGAKLWDGKSQTPAEVLKHADMRMYEDKKTSREAKSTS